jgi:Restriction Endonuclease associating with ARP
MSYQDKLKRHLSEYKHRELGISEPGVFRYRGRNVMCDHILPPPDVSRNLLEEARAAASAFLKENPKKRHRYFHHLNSSQAFAFNLFFAYFSGGAEAACALLRALGQEGTLAKWEPEAVPATQERSNIDVWWATTDGTQTFCEVKLSELDFGTAANDRRHQTKLDQIYAPVLAGHLLPERLETRAFFEAYQFNRNVWHLVRADRSRLIFLLPRSNQVLWDLLRGLLAGVVPRTRKRISAVAIEDVITSLVGDDRCPEALREYARKLSRKYVIPA